VLHGPPFGEELTEQAIEVLIRAPLLRAVYIGEVNTTPQFPLNTLVPAKLESIIAGNGPDGQAFKGTYNVAGARV
jgi:hypothetical protein